MRRKFFERSLGISTVLGAMAISACSASSAPGDGGPGDDTVDFDSDIVEFFSARLNGEYSVFDEGVTLEAFGSDDSEAAVWDLWKQANDSFTEDKLPSMKPLSNPSVGRWPLPADLEPSARMPFYWGSKGDKPENGYPLFLYLHGSGNKQQEWATGLSLCQDFEDSPSVYCIPQIPNTGDWYRWWQKSKQYAWEKLLRLAFLSGEIDPDRVYFFGISEGGYGSQRLASFYADYLAGAGPMAGGEPLKNAPAENCANMAFSLRTGEFDSGFFRNTLTEYTNDAFDALEAEHPGLYVHNIELIPGMGHGIDYFPTTPWLSSYKRNPYPTYVNWENFDMDGRFRDGFGNIQVLERSGENTRTRYVLSRSGNEVSLNVDDIEYTTIETDPYYGIEMKFSRKYTPATKGRIRLYFNDRMVDASEDVVLTVNGTEAFRGKLEASVDNMVNSCALFFDPMRVYPYSVDIDLSELQ